MSSIRKPNLPGPQNFNNGPGRQQFPGPGGDGSQRYYGPILAQGTVNAMHALQSGIAQACTVPIDAQPMSPWEVAALTQVVKGLEVLSKAKKRCGGTRNFNQHQHWAGNQAQAEASQAEDANQFQDNQVRQPAYAGAGR